MTILSWASDPNMISMIGKEADQTQMELAGGMSFKEEEKAVQEGSQADSEDGHIDKD